MPDATRAMSGAHAPGDTTRMEPAPWSPPTVERMQALLPQYQFVACIGRGGMGAVYSAIQLSLDRQVAVKILAPGMRDDGRAQLAERFRQEARTLAKMSHPCIVSVYDSGETSDKQLYFVMEYVEGTDVQKILRENGPLAPEQALAITAHVCDALEYAHGMGVIHRDIKPANVLISQEGGVKIADFGLAKALGDQSVELTRSNMVMGTPHYIAPEAMRAEAGVDGRADLYAVGVMLYAMLTGQVPTGRFELPSRLTGCDPRVDGIVDKAMQADRERRYQSATELRHALDTILTAPVPRVGEEADSAAGLGAAPAAPPAFPLTAGSGTTEQTWLDPAPPGRHPSRQSASSSPPRGRLRWALSAFAGMVLSVGVTLIPRTDKTKDRTPAVPSPSTVGIPVASAPVPAAKIEVGETPSDTVAASALVQSPLTPVKGVFYRIKNVNSRKALSADTDGAPLIQRIAGPSTRQHWEFVEVQNNYRIVNRRSRQFLQVHSLEAETPVVVGDGVEHSLWSLEYKEGGLQIRSCSSGLVIDVADEATNRKASIIQFSSHGSANQLFELVPVRD